MTHSRLKPAHAFLFLIPALLFLASCRTSRQTVRTEHSVESARSDSATHSDTAVTEAVVSVADVRADTALSARSSCGRIDIARDSAGLPVRIAWDIASRSADVSASSSDARFSGWSLSAVSGSSAVLSTDSRSGSSSGQVTETVSSPVPAETLVGSALLVLFVIYVVYVVLADYIWPWIRKRIR